jgi:hypothetical protein
MKSTMKWIERIGYGLLVAIPIVIVCLVISQAASPVYAQDQLPEKPDCKECHQAFYESWNNSAHGNSASNEMFKQVWEEQGEPGQCLACHATGYDPKMHTWESDGIACEICHSPVTLTHPLEPMGIQYSSELCGSCHTETHFEWQVSSHRQEGLECIGCHDPHKTGLKTDSPEELCASCHSARADNFAHSSHSRNGLTCADCHLGSTEQELGDGHGSQDHSFYVSLSTCTNCHAYQLHDPVEVHHEEPVDEQLDAMASVEHLSVVAEPKPVSPIGFSTVAGMVGLALGIVIAPWLEHWKKRLVQDKDEEE